MFHSLCEWHHVFLTWSAWFVSGGLPNPPAFKDYIPHDCTAQCFSIHSIDEKVSKKRYPQMVSLKASNNQFVIIPSVRIAACKGSACLRETRAIRCIRSVMARTTGFCQSLISWSMVFVLGAFNGHPQTQHAMEVDCIQHFGPVESFLFEFWRPKLWQTKPFYSAFFGTRWLFSDQITKKASKLFRFF